MRVKTLALLVLLYGCAPMPPISTGSPQPHSTVTPSSSPKPVASASAHPSLEPLAQPQLPIAMTEGLAPVAGLQPSMRDSETWWADSGIRDNRLAYYASPKSISELESQMSGPFLEGYREYLEGVGTWVSFEGMRVALARPQKEGPDRLLILAPLPPNGSMPAVLKTLKLPILEKPDWKGGKTLVVTATGQGLCEHMDHMLGQAGLTVTPSPAPLTTASATPSATPK